MADTAGVGTLETLTTTLIDSINGYRDAAQNAESSQFQELFRSMADDRSRVAEDLRGEIRRLGGNPPDDWPAHAIDWHLEQLRPWPAAREAVVQIHRSIAARGVAVARPVQTQDVVIHPGSGSPKKNWPAERFVELIERLRGAGRTVRVIAGEVERETWDAGAKARLAA